MKITHSIQYYQLVTSMNSRKLVILLHSWYWSIHPKDESKAEPRLLSSLVRCGVTALFGVFLHDIKRNGMTGFMDIGVINLVMCHLGADQICPNLILRTEPWMHEFSISTAWISHQGLNYHRNWGDQVNGLHPPRGPHPQGNKYSFFLRFFFLCVL